MPSPQQEKLLEILAGETGAISAAELAKKAGIPNTEAVRTQLGRLAREDLVGKDAQGEWTLAEPGREYLNQLTQETAGTSEYEIFMSLGRRIGVTGDLLRVVAEHVWSGGEYDDVNWVWKAMGEMDIRADQRKRWWNAWRSHLGKAIPPDLREEIGGKVGGEEPGQAVSAKKPSNDYIVVDDEPVRVGEGLGDYSLQDAKDILAMRALKSRFLRPERGGTDLSGTGEKLSDVITALTPFLSKDTDPEMVKEMLGDKLALLKQEIMSGLPHSSQPKSFIDQATDFIGILGVLKDSGPLLRSLLGIPEPSANPSPLAMSAPLIDKDGNPILTLDLAKFWGDEKRADEKVEQIKAMVEAFREKVAPALATWLGRMPGPKAPATSEEGTAQGFEGPCPSCGQTFTLASIPQGEFPCPLCGAILSPPEG